MVRHPAEKAAKSACTHSARLADRMPIASSLRRPRASRPLASSRTISPTSRQGRVRHAPPSFHCWAGRSPSVSTRCQNMLASVTWAMVPSSRLCAELFAQDLADRALGQRVHETDLLRPLEAGQAALAERADVRGGRPLAAPEHDEREHALPHQLILHADHRGLGHLGVGVEDLFDLVRVDVESAADDQVLLALDDEEEAVLVEPAHVPGMQPPGPHRPRRLLRVAVVADHDAPPADADLAHLARGEPAVKIVQDRDLDPGRSEEHTSELQSRLHLVCRLLLEKKKTRFLVISCALFVAPLILIKKYS